MMKNYEVTTNLRHNGTLYRRGEAVELTDSEAKRLLSLGVIEQGSKATPPDTPPKAPQDNNDTINSIVELFYQWHDKGNGIDKKPNVDSVRKALDNDDISVEQRDEAWNMYQSQLDVKNQDEDGE